MRIIVILLLSYLSLCEAIAQNLSETLNIYRSEIEAKGQGIWHAQSYVFIVAEQKCLKPKKYSGTLESKRATTTVLRMVANDLIGSTSLKIDEPELLAQGMRNFIVNQRQTRLNDVMVNGNLVIDEDNGNCVRKRALAFNASEYDKAVKATNKSLSEEDLSIAKRESIKQSLTRKDWSLLTQYALETKMLLPYLIWQTHESNQSLAHPSHVLDSTDHKFDSNLAKNLQSFNPAANCAICNYADQPEGLKDDVSGFLRYISRFAGAGLLSPGSKEQQQASVTLKNQANKNFEMAKFPNEIIQDLSMALYLHPTDTESLGKLGAVLRSLNHNQYALYVHTMAATLDPYQAGHYIHLIKVLQQLHQVDDARQIYDFLYEQYDAFNTDDWADSQLDALTQEFN